jgi:hypothetical protein
MLHHTTLWKILEPFCPNCSNSLTNQLLVHQRPNEGCGQLVLYLVQQISVCTFKSVFGTGRCLCDCATICFCYTTGCTGVKVTTEYAFIYVFVGPKTCQTFFFNISLPLYIMSVEHYIIYDILLLSLSVLLNRTPLPLDGLKQQLR